MVGRYNVGQRDGLDEDGLAESAVLRRFESAPREDAPRRRELLRNRGEVSRSRQVPLPVHQSRGRASTAPASSTATATIVSRTHVADSLHALYALEDTQLKHESSLADLESR